ERQAARPQLAVALRPPLLSRQATDLGLDFRDEVLEARQVCVGRLQPPLRDLPPVLVATDARGLLEHLPPLLRPVGQDPVHLPLLDHGVGVRAQPRVAEEVVDVLQPARRPVQLVLAAAFAEDRAPDLDLVVRDRQGVVVVREDERDLGTMDAAALRRALEDRLLHLRAADRRSALLAEHPADGVTNVGLAAAVRADDRGDALVELELRTVCERLEPVERKPLQLHSAERPRLSTSCGSYPARRSMSANTCASPGLR